MQATIMRATTRSKQSSSLENWMNKIYSAETMNTQPDRNGFTVSLRILFSQLLFAKPLKVAPKI